MNSLVELVGLEPTMPEAEDLQSPGVTNFPTTPYLVLDVGFELTTFALQEHCSTN